MVSDFKLLGGNLRFSVYFYSTVCHYFLCSLNPFNKMICKPKWKPTKRSEQLYEHFSFTTLKQTAFTGFFHGKTCILHEFGFCTNWWRKVIKRHNWICIGQISIHEKYKCKHTFPLYFLPQNTAAKIVMT